MEFSFAINPSRPPAEVRFETPAIEGLKSTVPLKDPDR